MNPTDYEVFSRGVDAPLPFLTLKDLPAGDRTLTLGHDGTNIIHVFVRQKKFFVHTYNFKNTTLSFFSTTRLPLDFLVGTDTRFYQEATDYPFAVAASLRGHRLRMPWSLTSKNAAALHTETGYYGHVAPF